MDLGIVLANWELALLLISWGVFGVLWTRKRIDWQHKRFSNQVNFSLNLIEEKNKQSYLHIRTLFEDDALNVWLNEHGVAVVRKAAAKTTLEDPFIRISDQTERDAIMTGLLNVLSEKYSEAFIARSLGLQVHTDTFLFGLTWERYGEMKTEKLRAIVVRKNILERMQGTDIKTLEASHKPRLHTLKTMYRLWCSSNPNDIETIREVELGVSSSNPPINAALE